MTRLFCQFTDSLEAGDQLYILGDFFNVWVGDDAISDFDKSIQARLHHITQQGVVVYMLYGNRDFLMREAFFKSTGVLFLADETLIELNGVKTLIMHGDSLCSDDRPYLRYKRFVRNPWVQRCFLSLPKSFRYKIAEKLRGSSRKYFDRSRVLVDVNQHTVIETLKKHSVTQLIHGHTHLPGIHYFGIDGNPATRIVLGAWHEKASILKISPPKFFELLEYP